MNINLNGEALEVKSATIADLLSEFKLTGKQVAVELNREIVPRSSYEQTALSSGDTVEVVQFVGGG